MTGNERYRWLRARGRCVTCAKKSHPGRARCETCAGKVSSAVRRLRVKKLAAGLCLSCSNPAVAGRHSCEKHLVMERERTNKRRGHGQSKDAA